MSLPTRIKNSNPTKPPNRNDRGPGHNSHDSDRESGGEADSAVDTMDRVATPKLFRVLLVNDDFTPMDFVVLVLRRFFAKTEEQATAIMLDVHQKGAGTAGVFTLEVAEMKVMQVNQFSRMNQHPLKATMEEAP